METIRKQFKNPAQVKKITNAYKTLYDRKPEVRLIGAFLVNNANFGDLIHLDRYNHEVTDITRNYVLVQVRTEFFRVRRAFDESLTEPEFIIISE